MARACEADISADRRKTLGQFFTGLPLSRILAHMALRADTRTVLDPMAGHGDLLDAVWEAASERDIILDRLDGIEIDKSVSATCRDRLARMIGTGCKPRQQIVDGSAFNVDVVRRLAMRGGYDLVITNPPYVRYQTRGVSGQGDMDIRANLQVIANDLVPSGENAEWNVLIRGYSGLSDLSIPSWLLVGLMVRHGGRFALVVPATWRSRDYADLIQYMLLRFFAVEYIVEDAQPGWFGNALVRTHLVVARRLPPDTAAVPLCGRPDFSSAQWVNVEPDAATSSSLVGAAFDDHKPEADFAAWLRNGLGGTRLGIRRRRFDPHREWAALKGRIGSKTWYRRLEDPETRNGSSVPETHPRHLIPEAVLDIIPEMSSLCTVAELGISVGQGLRTGCNRFFYVTVCSSVRNGLVRVKASPLFGNREFVSPIDALRPVLRRQSEVPSLNAGHAPCGRILDLHGWALPEDMETVNAHLDTYRASGESPPQTMREELASFVRLASTTSLHEDSDPVLIPGLSAVRTNVRAPDHGSTPRFWYMLPRFTARHMPFAFVPRINHGHPWTEANSDPPVLVDANFCSFWPVARAWTRFALKAMLNSIWCRTMMEATGTPLGGGALKLEAAHIRRMPVPWLSDADVARLHVAGQQLTHDATEVQNGIDRIVLQAVMESQAGSGESARLAARLRERAGELRRRRHGVRP